MTEHSFLLPGTNIGRRGRLPILVPGSNKQCRVINRFANLYEFVQPLMTEHSLLLPGTNIGRRGRLPILVPGRNKQCLVINRFANLYEFVQPLMTEHSLLLPGTNIGRRGRLRSQWAIRLHGISQSVSRFHYCRRL